MKADHPSDSLKYQWRIMGAVLRSSWATGLDKSIAFEIVDNYRKDFRNSRASLSYLMNATGADRKSVIASTRRLVANGPFSVIRQGAGTRPTEYGIDFDSVQDLASSGADTTTNRSVPSSGVEPTTTCGVHSTTSDPSSGVEPTQSVLPDAAYKAGIQDRKNDCATASPPVAVGLEAAAPGKAQGGFGELFKTYYATTKGHAGSRAKARAAYERMNVTPETHADLITSARAWHDAWAAQGSPDAPRMHLSTWIEREEFECDPPAPYQQKERKTKSQTQKAAQESKPKAPNSNSRVMRVIATEGIGDEFGDWGLRIILDDEFGHESEYVLDSVYTNGGKGPDEAIYRMISDLDGRQPGARLIVETKGDRIVRVKPAKATARQVEISEADSTDRTNVTAILMDTDGKPEGTIYINGERLKSLCEVLGIVNIQDTDELLFKPFVIDENGRFLPVSSELKEAA